MTEATDAVEAHVRSFFEGHSVDRVDWPLGPIHRRVPEFAVLRVGPGSVIPLWTYVSVGCWDAIRERGEHGLEFVITSELDSARLPELLAINCYYHAGPAEQRLDVGHTTNIGEPWLPGSHCDHWLVSLPYPYGPQFETVEWASGHARLLWLLPITEAERAFKATHGVEELEQLFEDQHIQFHSPARASAC